MTFHVVRITLPPALIVLQVTYWAPWASALETAGSTPYCTHNDHHYYRTLLLLVPLYHAEWP
jgi:hypothetical protein